MCAQTLLLHEKCWCQRNRSSEVDMGALVCGLMIRARESLSFFPMHQKDWLKNVIQPNCTCLRIEYPTNPAKLTRKFQSAVRLEWNEGLLCQYLKALLFFFFFFTNNLSMMSICKAFLCIAVNLLIWNWNWINLVYLVFKSKFGFYSLENLSIRKKRIQILSGI